VSWQGGRHLAWCKPARSRPPAASVKLPCLAAGQTCTPFLCAACNPPLRAGRSQGQFYQPPVPQLRAQLQDHVGGCGRAHHSWCVYHTPRSGWGGTDA
jgi:hypothetical protein